MIPDTQSASKPQRPINVRITDEKSIGREKDVASSGVSSQKPLEPENPMTQMSTADSATPTDDDVKESIAAAKETKNDVPVPSPTQDDDSLEKNRIKDNVTTKKVRRAIRKNLVDIGDVPKEDFSSGSPVVVSGDEITDDFIDKGRMSMRSSPTGPVRAARGNNEFQMMANGSPGFNRSSQAADLGNALTYELTKYQEPETGQKYFKLLVKVRDATINFPVIPKEIIFLVDASASIDEPRLREFEKGLTYSLNNLNPEDRFNIIVFKDKTLTYSPASLKQNPGNVLQGIGFIKRLKAGSRTDVFSALNSSINTKDNFNPSYRILLTDGFPTTGVTNTRQLINNISDINNNKVSIFAFGGGRAVSRYLLDFVAYKNRGWAEYVPQEPLIGQQLSRMYDKIKDPLLLNLRYHLSGVNEKEVFPRILPDFFKGSEFVIYGKFSDENKFFVQVLGNAVGGVKEFTVNAALKDAATGDKEIARQWAFHKIYHLIGQLKYKENNDDLIKEIDFLCEKFKIVTPYSRNFRELPKSKAVPAPAKPKPAPKVKAPVKKVSPSPAVPASK